MSQDMQLIQSEMAKLGSTLTSKGFVHIDGRVNFITQVIQNGRWVHHEPLTRDTITKFDYFRTVRFGKVRYFKVAGDKSKEVTTELEILNIKVLASNSDDFIIDSNFEY